MPTVTENFITTKTIITQYKAGKNSCGTISMTKTGFNHIDVSLVYCFDKPNTGNTLATVLNTKLPGLNFPTLVGFQKIQFFFHCTHEYGNSFIRYKHVEKTTHIFARFLNY